ncbi:hypothetical protein [Gilliamella sp. Pas-s25]|uniref:hypothetical protein n=1 Tax=Gilliamella sp. Pas-s25 TaxID=2687310 RepID=UPI00135D916E|nr:hypothetical protein [Gilliamella sp. Pas-s25]MWP63000.1 hypothetical protein [Gilliamella sp. Pas-s25]
MALLLLSCLWHFPALAGQNGRGDNRSDAIILPALQWGELKYVRPILEKHGLSRFTIPGIWDPDYGALVQSTNPASYALNFPTTGADRLYFYLLMVGEVDELIWESSPHEGIITILLERVTKIRCLEIEFDVCRGINRSMSFLKVTLKGPEANSQKQNPYPSRIAVPRLPQTFEIIGRDSGGNEVIKYGFVLQKWFVIRDDYKYVPGKGWGGTFQEQEAWCPSLGYRLTQVKDLTNAVCIDRGDGKDSTNPYFECPGSKFGALPSSPYNGVQRRIGAGFVTEWGWPVYYIDDLYPAMWIWTSDSDGDYAYSTDLSGGPLERIWKGNYRNTVCVTP